MKFSLSSLVFIFSVTLSCSSANIFAAQNEFPVSASVAKAIQFATDTSFCRRFLESKAENLPMPSPVEESLAQWTHKQRMARKWTQSDLALHLLKTPKFVNYLESGKGKIDEHTLLVLFRLFHAYPSNSEDISAEEKTQRRSLLFPVLRDMLFSLALTVEEKLLEASVPFQSPIAYRTHFGDMFKIGIIRSPDILRFRISPQFVFNPEFSAYSEGDEITVNVHGFFYPRDSEMKQELLASQTIKVKKGEGQDLIYTLSPAMFPEDRTMLHITASRSPKAGIAYEDDVVLFRFALGDIQFTR